MRTAAVAATALLALAAFGVLLLYIGFVRFNHPSLTEFPIHGVDVSHHQGPIEWIALAGPLVRFAYIKASEGATIQDPRFVANWNGARRAGIVPGAYHFFTLCRSGLDQAANFLGAIAQVGGTHLPPAIDLEYGGNCSAHPTAEAVRGEIGSFMAAVESKIGCRTILYVTQEFYEAYIRDRFPGRPIWMRNVYRQPKPGDGWLFWQFANRGRLPGAQTYIDLDVFRGDPEEFSQILCVAAPSPRG